MLEKHLWNTFLLCVVVEIRQLINEISSFPETLYKKGDLKNFSESTGKHKKQSPGGVLSKEKMLFKNLQNSKKKTIFARLSLLIKLQAGNLELSEATTGDAI